MRTYRVRTGTPFDEPFTVRPNPVVCVSDPEAPVKVTVALPLAASAPAENVTCCGVPGTRVILVGDIEIPVGTPVAWTLICDEKPLTAVADKETEAELPKLRD